MLSETLIQLISKKNRRTRTFMYMYTNNCVCGTVCVYILVFISCTFHNLARDLISNAD